MGNYDIYFLNESMPPVVINTNKYCYKLLSKSSSFMYVVFLGVFCQVFV